MAERERELIVQLRAPETKPRWGLLAALPFASAAAFESAFAAEFELELELELEPSGRNFINDDERIRLGRQTGAKQTG